MESYLTYLYIFFRCIGFIIITPVFGRRGVPAATKIGFAALLAFLVYPMVDIIEYEQDFWSIMIITIKESTVGIVMGFICLLMFSALYVAGEMIDLQMGFSMVNVLDPQSNSQVPLMGNFFYILAILVFLTVNGHHILISTIIKSYEILPLDAVYFGQGFLRTIVHNFIEMFVLGIKIAFPVVSVVLVVDVALGIIARTVPQMNVFIVGLPLKIAAGTIGMIMVMPMYLIALDVIYNGMYNNLLTLLRGMLAQP